MRVLVTGATGFLGSHLARRLLAGGHDVVVLARETSDRSRLDGLDVTLVTGDVTDRASVRRGLAGVDVVHHCAARLEFGPADATGLEAVNVHGTRNVLEEAAEAGVPAIHVSSVAALGATGPEPVDEAHWADAEPQVVYERTKRAGHLVARELAGAGAPVRIGIPGGIYGYGDTGSMAKLIDAFTTHPTPVGYLPELVQSLVQVDDCADALVRIAERGRDGEEYLVCADVVTFRQWFELIAAGAGRRPPFVYVPTSAVRWASRPVCALADRFGTNGDMVRETVEIATRHQAFSGDKARRELGWAPRPLRQGMAEMCGAIRRRNDRRRAERRRARLRTRSR